MSSLASEDGIDLILNILIRRCPITFISASMMEHCDADRYCDMKNVAALTALSFLLACLVSFQIVSLTMLFKNIGYKYT
jgi:hypothetical protein